MSLTYREIRIKADIREQIVTGFYAKTKGLPWWWQAVLMCRQDGEKIGRWAVTSEVQATSNARGGSKVRR